MNRSGLSMDRLRTVNKGFGQSMDEAVLAAALPYSQCVAARIALTLSH